ncbi:MAG: flagellar basal body-associated FliL family protein [Pseudomonadota bacterium]
MADATAAQADAGVEGAGAPDPAPARKRRGVLPLLIGVLGAAGAGGGMYWAVSSGMVPPPVATVTAAMAPPPLPAWAEWQPPDYVELPVITVSLGPEATARSLRARVTLEVVPGAIDPVTEAEPRVVATLVRFLRAVDERDLQQPAQMLRLQAQILRRIHLVTPPETVRAVLFQEFMLD